MFFLHMAKPHRILDHEALVQFVTCSQGNEHKVLSESNLGVFFASAPAAC